MMHTPLVVSARKQPSLSPPEADVHPPLLFAFRVSVARFGRALRAAGRPTSRGTPVRRCRASFAVFGIFVLAAQFALAGASRDARADGPFDGNWTMTPMAETYAVQQWVGGCGPAPVNGSAGGGGPVTIHAEGDELAIVGNIGGGSGKTFKTNQCWDPTPTLQRVAHSASASGRAWTTRCATPPGDPRRATITTNISASSDSQIVLVETGRYELNLSDGQCIADVRRTSTFNLVARTGAAPSASVAPPAPSAIPLPPPTAVTPPPPPLPPPSLDCSAPGEPARLEVRPSRKLMRAGESFTYKATVFDARGCATQTPATWKLAGSRDFRTRPSVDNSGTLRVPADAAEGEFEIEVTAAGKSTRVSFVVTSPANYQELLSQSGLNANGEKADPSVAVIATGSIGGQSVHAEDTSRTRKLVFVCVVAGLALLFGVVALVAVKRSRRAAAAERAAALRDEERLREFEERKRGREEKHAAQVRAHLDSVQRAQDAAAVSTAFAATMPGGMVCPSCRTEYPAGSTFCPQDANRLLTRSGHEHVLTGPSGGICPACKRGFNPGVTACPHDGEALVPFGTQADRPPAAPPSRGRICPTCGGRFDGTSAFCGKDGTALVLVN